MGTAVSCGSQKLRWCCVKTMRKHHAVWKMKVDPWSGRQGRKSGKVRVLSPSIACSGRIAYPVRAEVTKHAQPGCKSLGCPAEFAAVGAIWEVSKLRGVNITECLPTSKLHRGKIAFAEETGSRPKKGLGKADDTEEETGKCTRWDRRDWRPRI